MKCKTALLLGCMLVIQLLCSPIFAQTIISGKVTNKSTGEPLQGATVTVKGTASATQTDKSGSFSISTAVGQVLVVTYSGMAEQEFPVVNNHSISVQLDSKITSLNEVVVIGYGTQKKSVVTGSISSVKGSDLNNQPINRIEQFLQGRASGLTVAASSGQPGSSSTLRVRGTTSLNNSDPLYIVDGVPVDIGGIDYLNPSDIESVEVLKDAASAAIYGARAASGVILITTKKGRVGKTTLNYDGYYGVQAPAHRLELLNATEYAVLRNEASVAGGGGIVFPDISTLGKGTDWQSLIFNDNAKIQNHELSISGGNDKSTFYTSFGFFDQEGIVASDISKYSRFNFRMNGTHKINNWLSLGTNLGYSHIKSSGVGNTNSEYGGVLSSAINLDPITKAVITDPSEANSGLYTPSSTNLNGKAIVKDEFGNPYGISTLVVQEMSNPLAYIKTHLGNFGWSDNLVGNAYLEIEPVKGLKVRSNLGTKMAFWGSESFTPFYYYNPSSSNISHTSFYTESNRALNYTWENTASYNHSFGLHNFTALVGSGAYVQNYMQRGMGSTYRDVPVNTFDDAKNMHFNLPDSVRIAWGSEAYPNKVSSLYGRLSYDYAEKYLFQGILRRDGSSHFGSNNKYGYFPSGSVGWVASKENFWPVNRFVTFLKVRGSYGVTGNDNIENFAYVSSIVGGRNYTFGNNDLYTYGYSPGAIANPDLKWEETSQTNIGFDANVLKDFTLTFDWYTKKTSGILRRIETPLYVGVSGPIGNIADMENKGVELELGWHKTISGVRLDLKGNVSHLTNTVTFISNSETFYKGASLQSSQLELTRVQVGHAIGSFYGYKTEGIFQTEDDVNNYKNKNGELLQPSARPGDFRWADLDGDGKITTADRTFIGDPTPDWSFGFTASASFKGFDLLLFGQGVAGNQIYNGLRRLDISTANWSSKAMSRWTGPGTSNDFPRLSTNDVNGNFSNPSSFYLENGDYFRIKVLQLGYTLPNQLTNRAGIQKVRVYVSANNLVTLTNYTGYDPEIGGSSYGIDRGFYPQARSFTGGINLTF
jgi:TonB-dependent starch-binding outer membrane protein SusC